jgi:hypothetical protein
MCIIIVKPVNKVINERLAEYCWNKNKDGAGFVFSDNNRLRIYKHVGENFYDFWKLYNRYVRSKNKEKNHTVIMHFRIATHGSIEKMNCHPFRINQELCFAHNGVIVGITVPKDSKKSDTNLFNDLLKKLPSGWTKNKTTVQLVQHFIGSNSKLAFMDNDGEMAIFNEARGDWDEDTGLWFSNLNYKGWDFVYTPVESRGTENKLLRHGHHRSGFLNPHDEEDRINDAVNNSLTDPKVIGQLSILDKKTLRNEDFSTCISCGFVVYTPEEMKVRECAHCAGTRNAINRRKERHRRKNLH